MLVLFHREFVSSVAEVLLSRIQYGLYPLWLVGRVGILLALKTYADVLRIRSVLVLDVQFVANTLEVSAVYLYTRLVGEHLHEDTGFRRIEAGADLCVVALTVLECVQTPVVVVTTGILNLVKLRLDAVANSVRCTEVHRRTLNRLISPVGM